MLFALDPRTVLLSFILTQGLLALVMISVWASYRGSLKGLGLLAIGFSLVAIGQSLVGHRGVISPFLSIVSGPTLMTTGFAFIVLGLKSFSGARLHCFLTSLAPLTVLVVQVVFGLIGDNYRLRVLGFAWSESGLAIGCAVSLLLKGPVAFRHGEKARLATVGLLFGMGLFSIARVAGLLFANEAPNDLMVAAPVEIVFLLASMLTFVGIGFSILQMINARLSAHLANAAEERALTLREMHHRIKNDLSLVESLARLEMDAVGEERLAQAFASFGERVHAISLVHERLSRSESGGSIDLGEYLRELTNTLSSARGDPTGRIHVEDRLASVEVDASLAVTVGLLVNELVMNALKHAFPGERRGRVLVELKSLPGSRLRIIVEDDGVGLALGVQREGLGTTLVEGLSSQLGGKPELVSAPGAGLRFVLEFAVSAPGSRGRAEPQAPSPKA